MENEQVVTPWKTKCGREGFNYTKLVEKFGCDIISDKLLERFEKVTGCKPHIWLKRGIFFAHRELDKILDAYEINKPIYLYTGRGPTSEALHLGHSLSFIFTKWLQDALKAFVIIQMADDEKYYFKDRTFEDIYKLGFENAKDIIACGFNPEKTFIFSNRDFSGNKSYNKVFCDISKHTNLNVVQAIFGLEKTDNIGQYIWPIYQTTASFSQAFSNIFNKDAFCLVAYAIDQDPYFRLARDVAPKLGYHKPSSIITRFLPALEGNEKMSTTGNCPTIYMTDTNKQISTKINKYAYSGGRDTLEEHQKYGANLDTDISFQYLRYFEQDDKKLEKIAQEYSLGKMLSGEIKKIIIEKLCKFIEEHKNKREAVSQNDIKQFYKIKIFE